MAMLRVVFGLNMMRRWPFYALMGFSLLGCQLTPSPQLKPMGELTKLQLEWADTPQERMRGLMERSHLPENAGMMFMFESAKPQCFWMKNTLIPLSVGFINPQGKLVQIEDMQPQTLDHHCTKEPVLYALEVNQGWFERHQVKLQSQVLQTPPAK